MRRSAQGFSRVVSHHLHAQPPCVFIVDQATQNFKVAEEHLQGFRMWETITPEGVAESSYASEAVLVYVQYRMRRGREAEEGEGDWLSEPVETGGTVRIGVRMVWPAMDCLSERERERGGYVLLTLRCRSTAEAGRVPLRRGEYG